jgi:hypothetical protein
MSIYASNERIVVKLKSKIEQNARAISGTSKPKLGDLITELKADWLTVTPEEWEPHFDVNSKSPERERLAKVLTSGLFLPNGYTASLTIDPVGLSHFDVHANLQSLRHNANLSLEDDPVMADCNSIDFSNYPSMGVYKALLGYMYSRDGNKHLDFFDWHKEITGEYPHGGSAYDTPHRGRYSWADHRFIGATGMMHTPEVANELRKISSVADHFDAEQLVSFRGSGAADHTIATRIANGSIPELPQLTRSYCELVSRGVSLN